VLAQELCVPIPAGARNVIPPPPPPTAHKHKRWLWVVAGAVATFLLLAVIESVKTQNQPTPADGSSQETSTPAAATGEQVPAATTQRTPASVVGQAAAASAQPATTDISPAASSSSAPTAAATAWQRNLMATIVAMNNSRQQMATILSNSPRSLAELQEQARQLLGAVDGYDQQVDNFSGLLSQGQSEGYLTTSTDRAQVAALQQVCGIRKQQSARYRYESQLVLQYNPDATQYAVLLNQLMSVQAEINSLDVRAAALMQQAGVQ
jgi:hypothetical protein